MEKVKVITKLLHRQNQTVNSSVGEFIFDEKGISQEVNLEIAQKFVDNSEGNCEIYKKEGGNFKTSLTDLKKEINLGTSTTQVKTKAEEDMDLAKSLAKKTVPELMGLAADLNLPEEEYKKLEKIKLIKYLIEKSSSPNIEEKSEIENTKDESKTVIVKDESSTEN